MGSWGRRALLLGALSGCAGGIGGSSPKLVIADVQSLLQELRSIVTKIEEATSGRDKGIDKRIRRCLSSLDVVDLAMRSASGLTEEDLFQLLGPFQEAYRSLALELDEEGLVRNDMVISDDGTPLVRAPSGERMAQIIRDRAREARAG